MESKHQKTFVTEVILKFVPLAHDYTYPLLQICAFFYIILLFTGPFNIRMLVNAI